MKSFLKVRKNFILILAFVFCLPFFFYAIPSAKAAETLTPKVEIGAENYYLFEKALDADFSGSLGVVAQRDELILFFGNNFERKLEKKDFPAPYPDFSFQKVRISGEYIIVLVNFEIAPHNLFKVSTVDFSCIAYENFANRNIVDFEIFPGTIYVESRFENITKEYFSFINGEFGNNVNLEIPPVRIPSAIISDNGKTVINNNAGAVFSTQNQISNLPSLISSCKENIVIYDYSGFAKILNDEKEVLHTINNLNNARAICLIENFLLAAFPSKIEKYDFNGNATATYAISNVISLAANFDKEIFALDSSGRIYKFDKNLQSARQVPLQNSALGAKQIALSERNSNLYILFENRITIFDGAIMQTACNFGGENFALDFDNNFYIQTGTQIRKWSGNSITAFETKLLPNYNSEITISSIAIDKYTGKLLLCDRFLSTVFSLEKEDLGIKLPLDPQNLKILQKVLSKSFLHGLEIVTIKGFPSTIFYPQNSGDANFEANFSFESITSLPAGSSVIKIFEDGDFLYVFDLETKTSGFILTAATETKYIFETAIINNSVLNSAAKVYSLPIIEPEFEFFTLTKDSVVKAHYSVEINGIKYTCVSQGQNYGFTASYNLSTSESSSLDLRKKASVLGIKNSTNLYSENNISSMVLLTIKDNSKVKIIEQTGSFYYVEYNDGTSSYTGYIESKFLVFDGFSNSQRLGLVIFFSMLALLVITVLIRKRIIN